MKPVGARGLLLCLALAPAFAPVVARAELPADARKIALIYNGPGACVDEKVDCDDEDCKDAINDCSAQAAQVAKMAGYKPKFVGPDALGEKSTDKQIRALFEQGRVWIQPGGDGTEAVQTMSDPLIDGLKKFIRAGGGYVGFCAGAFMATETIARRGGEGLGIIPGHTRAYHNGFALETVTWLGKERQIYFEGGPYFYGYEPDPSDKSATKVEVVATYATGAAASIRTNYGKGRVWVTGLHPEAPLRWTQEDGITDPDGIEQRLAAEMVRWSGSASTVKMPTAKTRDRNN